MAKSSRPKYCEEPPKWFDLEKYQAVRDLDAKGWLYQLSSRLTLDVLWQPRPENIADQLNSSEPNEWQQTTKELQDAIKKDGVLKPPYDLPDRFADPYDDFFGAASFEYGTVRQLTNLDVYQKLLFRDHRNKISTMIECYCNSSTFEDSTISSTHEWADQIFQGDHMSSTFVGIDLNVRDDQLIEDFEKWLGGARKTLGYPQRKKGNFNESDFRTWRHFQVLPYIDLQLWAEKSGFKYSNEFLSYILFPQNPEAGNDTVRRTVQKHANNLRNAYPALRAQVESTVTEQLT